MSQNTFSTSKPGTLSTTSNALGPEQSALGDRGQSEGTPMNFMKHAVAVVGGVGRSLYSIMTNRLSGSEQSPQIDNSYYRSVIIILFVITIIYLSLVTVSILIKKDARELKCNPLGFLLVNIIPGVEKDDIYKQCISTYEEDTRNKLQTDYNAKVFDISSSIIDIKQSNEQFQTDISSNYNTYVTDMNTVLDKMEQHNNNMIQETNDLNADINRTLNKIEVLLDN